MSMGIEGNTKDLLSRPFRTCWFQEEFCIHKYLRIEFEDEKLLQISNIFILIQCFAPLNHTGFS